MLREATALALSQNEEPEAYDPAEKTHERFSGSQRHQNLRSIVDKFLAGTLEGRAHDKCSNANHYYTARNEGKELWLFKDNPSIPFEICVAKRIKDRIFGNSSSLAPQRTAGGKLNWSGGQQKVQSILAEHMPMIPFRMFEENDLPVESIEIVESGPEEWLDVNHWSKKLQHFAGSMLFSLQGKEAREFFLFDIDRNDLALQGLNVFLSKLARPCSSITDAYESLKPQEIKDAERFLEQPCRRQGEWFFVPVFGDFKPMTRGNVILSGVLSAKGSSNHLSSQISKEGYVRGSIRHEKWAHVPIALEGWHKPVANGATVSFKITGHID